MNGRPRTNHVRGQEIDQHDPGKGQNHKRRRRNLSRKDLSSQRLPRRRLFLRRCRIMSRLILNRLWVGPSLLNRDIQGISFDSGIGMVIRPPPQKCGTSTFSSSLPISGMIFSKWDVFSFLAVNTPLADRACSSDSEISAVSDIAGFFERGFIGLFLSGHLDSFVSFKFHVVRHLPAGSVSP